MKIFITGSTGFVGMNLVEFYKDHEIFCFSRENNLQESLEHFQPDVIINSAADIYNADLMWEPNVLFVHTCLEFVKNNPNTSMIQIGSSSEYGKLDRPSREIDRINPIDMYQATKGAATLLCQGYARYYKLNIKIARPYSVYGRHERPHRLFPNLWKAFNLDRPMKLYQGYHDFIFIDDFIRGINVLLTTNNDLYGDIVNFGSGIQYSNFEVLDMFEKVTGRNAPVEKIESFSKAFENNIWVCDTSYALDEYKFKVDYDLYSGIDKFLKTATYI